MSEREHNQLSSRADSETPSSILRSNLHFISNTYGVEVRMHRFSKNDETANISELTKLNFPEATIAISILREEFGKYPPDLLKKLILNPLRIVEDLKLNVENKDDVENKEIHDIGGLADKESWQTYVAFNSYNLSYFRSSIHHEIFHMAEFNMEDEISARWIVRPIIGKYISRRVQVARQNSWRRMNTLMPFTDPYLRDRYNQKVSNNSHQDVQHGHANNYGSKDEYEDKATIAEKLMTDPFSLIEHAWTTGGFVLQNKIKAVKKFYKQISDGKMDKYYFSDLEQGKVTEGYFA